MRIFLERRTEHGGFARTSPGGQPITCLRCQLFTDAIDSILANPSIGEDKQGDLAGVKGYDIYYCKINYELAYTVETVIDEETGETEIVVVIMAGTRENFYDELKRYWKRK